MELLVEQDKAGGGAGRRRWWVAVTGVCLVPIALSERVRHMPALTGAGQVLRSYPPWRLRRCQREAFVAVFVSADIEVGPVQVIDLVGPGSHGAALSWT
ncbi:hypothetical protein [Streptomyces avermitilis]|uniref:hypothetical protein n=1 Tax=Streptomyces avermitilis TaxID=33903 RepID=UPI00367F1EB9